MTLNGNRGHLHGMTYRPATVLLDEGDDHPDDRPPVQDGHSLLPTILLTFWRRTFFFQILAHSVLECE